MQRRITWVLLPLCWALACGGRFAETRGGDDDDTSPDQGSGGSGMSGSPSAAGKAAAGSVGVSGAGPMCTCDPRPCEPNYQSVPNADGCCFHCELDLKACEVQRQVYITFREQLIDKFSQGCVVAGDCLAYYDRTLCGAYSCGIPVPTANYKNLISNLASY